MNVYDLSHVNGELLDVEADFYERAGEDYVFYAKGKEVLRIDWQDVMSISKSPLRPRLPETSDHVWI